MSPVNGLKLKARHSMQGVFVFVLLGLFAVMSTLMVLLGAQMYRGTVDRSADNNRDRVLAAYVRSMLRSGDARGAVTAQTYDAFPSEGDENPDDGLVDFGTDDGLVDLGGDAGSGDGLVDLGGDAEAAEDAAAEAPALRWVPRDPEAASAPEGAVESLSVVTMTEEIDGEAYATYIYHYDGALCELFSQRDYPFRPGDGTAICEVAGFGASIRDGLATVRMSDSAGRISTVRVALRCEE